MLVLTRKNGEIIHIGENIIITVLGLERGRVRLGVEALPETMIYRGEVWDKMHKKPLEAKETAEGKPA